MMKEKKDELRMDDEIEKFKRFGQPRHKIWSSEIKQFTSVEQNEGFGNWTRKGKQS